MAAGLGGAREVFLCRGDRGGAGRSIGGAEVGGVGFDGGDAVRSWQAEPQEL
jgi:hypothetical protein